MSIIVVQINKHGIVFGTDSNITSGKEIIKEDKKIFIISKLGAALCCAGAYTVGGEILSNWMPNFISKNVDKYDSLENFTKLLSENLNQYMTPAEKCSCFIAHISGYQNGHPEMWCLSNTTLEDQGNYSNGTNNFHYSEDFWGRDYKNPDFAQAFKSDGINFQIYVNAVLEGRVSFNLVTQKLITFFKSIWSISGFKFRPPQNINEYKLFVRLCIDCTISAYQLSDYEPKIIGGAAQLYVINNPAN